MLKRIEMALPYKQKIALAILMFSLIPYMLLGSIYLISVWNGKVGEIISENRSMLKNDTDNINNILLSAAQKAVFIGANSDLSNFFLQEDSEDLITILSFYHQTSNIFGALTMDNSGNTIAVYSLNKKIMVGDYLKNAEDLDKSIVNASLASSDDMNIWRYASVKNDQKIEEYICLYRKLLSVDRPLAIIEIKIPVRKLIEQFQYMKMPKGSFIMFVQDEKRILLRQDNMDMDTDKIFEAANDFLVYGKDNGNLFITTETKAGNGKLLMYIPKSYATQKLSGYFILYIAIFIGLSISIAICVKVVSHHLTKRLSNLIAEINGEFENDDDGNLKSTFIMSSGPQSGAMLQNDEFSMISRKFYKLIDKIREYYSKMAEYESNKKTMELELQRLRINPHFLYNTLSAIKWAFYNDKLSKIIESMVKYYRYALNQGNNITTISQEIEMTEEYLSLMKFTFNSNFTYRISIDEKIMKCTMLNHLLQPIVENAVLHGANSLDEGGEVLISGWNTDDRIYLEVKDNGRGIDSDTVRRILNGEKIKVYGGFGIRNVQKRIEICYGSEYGVNIESELNKGTTVTVTIPFNGADPEN